MKNIKTISIFKSPIVQELSTIQNKENSEKRLAVNTAINAIEPILKSDDLTEEGEYSGDEQN